jgi:PAS domain S-box-containing protein
MDAEGHRTGRIDSLRDIDAEVRAQLLLAEQSQRLMLVLAASRLGMWDWNLVTGETAFDERWAEIAGYRLDELEPTSIDTWQRLAHPGDLATSEAMIAEHLAGRAPFYDLELRVRHREGHWVWVHDRGQVVERSPDGRPTRMMGTHEDISARVTAVETLNANRYDLEQAQRIAHVGSWSLDLATDHVTWTDELFLMLGLDPAERRRTTRHRGSSRTTGGRGSAPLLEPGDRAAVRPRNRVGAAADQHA